MSLASFVSERIYRLLLFFFLALSACEASNSSLESESPSVLWLTYDCPGPGCPLTEMGPTAP